MPRIFGHDLLAVIAASAVFYAVGFVIYAALFTEQWMAMAGYTEEILAPHRWKMALSPIMPILGVLGLAFVFNKAGVSGFMPQAKMGLAIGFFFAVSTAMYGFAYGPGPWGLFFMDAAHMLIAYTLAGAVLALRK
ncbi:MAG: DUF1761 domain-containing protein [Maricaulaceae bacterium]|nr:DUF1761 domain-containing protein [Maricaulaceae bacterium]